MNVSPHIISNISTMLHAADTLYLYSTLMAISAAGEDIAIL